MAWPQRKPGRCTASYKRTHRHERAEDTRAVHGHRPETGGYCQSGK
jgi:hypothetical protein